MGLNGSKFSRSVAPNILRTALALVAAGLFVVGLVLPSSLPAVASGAGINQTINYQGRLLTASGAVVADGNYNMKFKIYQDGSGNLAGDIIDGATPAGTLMWTELHENVSSAGIVVKNGYFSVALGGICAFTGGSCQGNTNTAINWNWDTLWLSMNVAGTGVGGSPTYDGELLPMKRMASTVYAFQAQSASTCTSCLLQAPTSTAQNTIAPTGASTVGLTVKQTSTASPTGDILDVFGTNGTTSFIQVTSIAANAGAVTVQSQGANALTLQSGSGTVTLGTSTVLTASGALTVQSTGSNPLTLAANGSNQNVNVSPTGTGSVLIGGTSPTIGTATAASPLALVIQTGTASGGAGSNLTLKAGTASSGAGGTAILQGGNTVAAGTDGQATIDAGSGATTPNGTVNIGGANASVINEGSVGSTIKATDVHINDSTDATKTLTTTIGSAAANTADITIIQGGSNTTQAIQLTPNTAGGILIGAGAGTGAVTVGSSSTTQSVLIGNGAGVPTVNIANASVVGATVNIAGATNTSGTTAVNIANGASAATSNVNILSGAGTAGAATLLMADNPRVTQIDLGNVANAANRTTNIAVGATPTGVSDTVNIATGNTVGTGTKVVHIADGTPAGSNTVFVGSLAVTSANTIQAGTGNINFNTNQAGAGTLVKTVTTNSTTAFQIQNSVATSFFTADSTKDIITTNDVNVGSAINISPPGRLFSDGFETGDGTALGNDPMWIGGSGGTGTITTNETTTVRNGKYSAKIATSTQSGYIQTTIVSNNTVFARTYFDNTATTSPTELLDLGTAAIGSGTHLYIYLGASGFLCYNYGGNGTAAGGTSACSTTAITAFAPGPWHKLEAKMTISASVGVLQVWLDNTLVTSNSNAINLSGQNFGTASLTNIAIGGGLSQGANTTYYDDVAVDTVATGDSSSLNVNDSLRVSGSTSIGTSLLVGVGTTSSSGTLTVKSEQSNTTTQAYTSAVTGQTWVVPANVTSITTTTWGAGGGGGAGNGGATIGGNGGGGGYLKTTLPVTPGETLTIDVGSGGARFAVASAGGGGGGYSEIKRGATVLAQAGGGGGGAGGGTTPDRNEGGGGGGADGTGGGAGDGGAGAKGTTIAGGAGGTLGTGGVAGHVGAANVGGDAGGSAATCTTAAGTTGNGGTGGGGKGGNVGATCNGGGGGGGGAFGGGGGGSSSGAGLTGGGGGGGSGHVDASGTNTVTAAAPFLDNAAADHSVDSRTYANCAANAGNGGLGNPSNASTQAGNPGCVVLTYATAPARSSALNVQTSDGTDMFKISSSGAAYFKNSVDSTLAAQFLDTSGAPVLTIDTLSGIVTIGSGATGEAVPNLLVLDNGTSASDPATASNGSMYYNANSDKFRCYEASVWIDCLSGVQTYHVSDLSIAGTTTSTTNVNFPGSSSVTFTKQEASSKVFMNVGLSWYQTVASNASFVDVEIAGAYHSCARFYFNALGQHMSLSCTVLVTGVAAGSQTAQVKWRENTGTGTLHVNQDDYVSLTVQETE